jgi:hypothetical protein
MIAARATGVDLRAFFDRVIRASFHDLALDGDPAAPYLADLLTRFARSEQLHPRALTLPRLESVVDMMLEIQAVWQVETPEFRPEHEVNVRRHIGDYTLFMTGIFPERVQREATTTSRRASAPIASCPSTPAPRSGARRRRTAGSPSASRATPARSITRAACTSATRLPFRSSGCWDSGGPVDRSLSRRRAGRA